MSTETCLEYAVETPSQNKGCEKCKFIGDAPKKKAPTSERLGKVSKTWLDRHKEEPTIIPTSISLLLKGKPIALLDIRLPDEIEEASFEEFKADHKLFYAISSLTDTSSLTDELLKANNVDKNEPLVVFCRSGRRAEVACTALEALGCEHVFNGGGLSDMIESSKSSLPV